MVKIIFQYDDAIVTGRYETEAKAQDAVKKALINYPGIRILDIRSVNDGATIGKLHKT